MSQKEPQRAFAQVSENLDPSWVKGKWRPRSMALQTIKNNSRDLYQEPRETNKLSDIMGAQPRRMRDYQDKIEQNSVHDIAGARPRKLHVGLNKPSNFLVNDIEGAHPATRTFHSRRCVNPLSPKYQLPSYTVDPPPPTKFVRDSLDTSDMPGAQPRKPKEYKTRDNINVFDISGATPKVIKVAARRKDQLMEGYEPVSCTPSVMDIAKEPRPDITGTHPMRPVYFMHDVRIEDDIGSYPRKAKAPREPFYSLHTSDISGAKAFSGYQCFPHMGERREYRKINDLSDVDGATADTRQRGLQSKRITDPLDPRYVNLDGKLATSRTARRKLSKLKGIGPVVVVKNESQLIPTPSTTGRGGSSRRLGNQEENERAENASMSGTARPRTSKELTRRVHGVEDHLKCGLLGLAPVAGDEILHTHGVAAVDGALTKDHFNKGMLLEDGCSTDCDFKVASEMLLKGKHDHLTPGMVPEDGSESAYVRQRRASTKSEDQQDHIVNWDIWKQGGRYKVAMMKLKEEKRKSEGRRASESNAVPWDFGRATDARPLTSGGARMAPFDNNKSTGRRASLLGNRQSVTSRSSSSLRSGSLSGGMASHSARPTTAAPYKARTSRSTGSLSSRAGSLGSLGSTVLSNREISQIDADRRSVAELPDSVV